MKVLLNSCDLNGHTLGFHPLKKVEPHLLTQGLTLGVKGLIILQYPTLIQVEWAGASSPRPPSNGTLRGVTWRDS